MYAKLAAGLTVLLIAIGLLYSFLSTAATRHYLQQVNQQLNRDLAQNIVADRNLVAEDRLNDAALKKTFALYMTINPGIEIYLLDLEGKILSFSADPKKIKRNSVSLKPIRSFLEMEEPYPLLGDDPRDHNRQKAFSVTPVPSKLKPEGYLYVVLRGERYDFAEQMAGSGLVLRMSGWAVATSLALGLLAGLLLFHLLTRRLRGLSNRMRVVEQSGFTETVISSGQAGRETSGDEIDQLGQRFDRMAGRIREQIGALREQDGLRRRLVAQVSHDLRTPLASIQGYLETLQIKGARLSEKERAEFVEVALRQGHRLRQLVDELFELAALDAHEKQPDTQPFAAAELTHDAVEKHLLKARAGHIEIGISSPRDLPLALGDIAMTERVLDNLIENALQHTPENGNVTISLHPGGDAIAIAVSDNGSGILDSDLPFVFEAFFQSDPGGQKPMNNGNSGRAHAGLGLAIAQRIMVLQNGSIKAENRPEGGARFTFSLPVAP